MWVQPGASRTEASGIVDDRLKIRIAAPPVDGQANDALLKWCAKRLGVARRDVELLGGAGQRRKVVGFTCDLGAAEVVARLLDDRR